MKNAPSTPAKRSRAPDSQEPAAAAREPAGTQAIDRALAVLFSFTPNEPIRRVPELTRMLDLNKSTVYRLLQALCAVDLVRREEETGAYRLGPAVLDLANCFLSTIDLGAIGRPIMQAFALKYGESVNLAVIDGTDAVRIDTARGTRMPQLVSSRGMRIPIYCSAAGKALLFDHTEDQVRDLLSRSNLEKLTRNTIVDPESFLTRLRRERKQGWTLNDEESEVGIRVIGAPIRDHANAIVASVSVSAPNFRLPERDVSELGRAVLQMARDISAALGARGDTPAAKAAASRSGKS